MNAATHPPHRDRLESNAEPIRSCECDGPLVAVLRIDGEDRALCEACLAAHSHLFQVPDGSTDARGMTLLSA